MTTKKIYFVRHGESMSNISNVVHSGLDELSEEGHVQAVALAERLKQLHFQNLLVSDFVRTKQTVVPLLVHTSIEPIYTPLVRELRRPSELVGFSLLSSDFLTYTAAARTHIGELDWHFSDEENFYDVVARIKEFFALIDTLEGDTIVVSHGRFIIFVMMYVIMGGNLTHETWQSDMDTFTTTNTGITVLSYKEHKKLWALTTYNDHSHFAE